MAESNDKSSALKHEMIEKMVALITAAFGLVAALAWNDTIKLIFDELFGEANTAGPMLFYAVTVTNCCNFDNYCR